ncbi:MAG: carbamoyltransferase [Candidatus Omnitrophica bacterium]|nr:carbamoyltransferase [Candidatus Omnitrophota bacterium]
MKILGVGPSMEHDPAAALVIDGKVVAAAEEERFIREKHAFGKPPIKAIEYCLDEAGIAPEDIDAVAFGWSPSVFNEFKMQYFRRKFFYSPDRAIKILKKSNQICRMKTGIVKDICDKTGIDYARTDIHFVEHHLAHASSAYHLSGFKDSAILSVDGGGEFTSTLMAESDNGNIRKIKEICVPDSIGLFYSTLTEYLGFKSNNGEYKVMGMAPYGDPSRIDMDHLLSWNDKKKTFKCNDNYVWVKRSQRYDKEKMYSKACVRDFGPPREGEGLQEPYIHVAAKVQKKLEEITVKLVDAYLEKSMREHGNLCFAGGCALNVALNRILLEKPYIKNLWVQPASHDAGTSLGAAIYVASEAGEKIRPMKHAYLGPEFTNDQIAEDLKEFGFPFKFENDIADRTAELLHQGKIVGWFQGRMEWGPRSLGSRSILGNPAVKGTADKINAMIKFREKWRPFCPSILKEHASSILDSDHPAPFMTIAFKVNPEWGKRIPEVVHVDGTCRPQVVDPETNPKFHNVIEKFYQKTGVPVVINTSLNRRGEPVVCTPGDALIMFRESGLEYMAMGDFLVCKNEPKNEY